jgi:hypothetical protein
MKYNRRRNGKTRLNSYFEGGRKSIILLEGSQVSPAHPSDKNSMKIKMLELCKLVAWNKKRGIVVCFESLQLSKLYTVRSKSFRPDFFKNRRHISCFIHNELHWHIYKLLRGRTVSEKPPKISLFGPSWISTSAKWSPFNFIFNLGNRK